MNWTNPHITKILEAFGAIVDDRLEMGENNTAKVYSSSRNKFYVVLYDSENDSIMTNDNASYYIWSLGYPSIAYLMKIWKIPFDLELAMLFSGIPWKDINQQFKNDFDKTMEYILINLAKQGHDIKEIREKIQTIQDFIVSREWKMNGGKILPPDGY